MCVDKIAIIAITIIALVAFMVIYKIVRNFTNKK